jgi:hypothetical protein
MIRAGNIVVDKYGLATGTAIWWAYSKSAILSSGVTALGFPHPDAPTLKCEKLVYSDSDGGATLEASYAGILGNTLPAPVDELDTSTMEVPIDAHPAFATFAGSSNATRLNGAVFRTVPNTSPVVEVFDCFGPDAPAGFRGVTSFLAPASVSRRTTITTTPPQPGAVGYLRTPYNTFGITANWLLVGCSSQLRGNVYVTKYEWKAGGRIGWNTAIYS